MQHTNKLIFLLGILYGTVTLSSCQGIFVSDKEKEVVARVGENFLYKEDLVDLVGKNLTKEDSTTLVTNYINNWASKQLLMSKSKVNLSEEQLAEFDRLVANYKTDLYTGLIKKLWCKKSKTPLLVKKN